MADTAILRFGNDSNVVFTGWLRATVDADLAIPSGLHELGSYVMGNSCGLDTHCIDLYCSLAPNGDRRQIFTGDTTPFEFSLQPSDWPATVTIGGVAMTFVGETANGPAWDGEWFVRIGPMLAIRLFVHAYIDDPSYAYAEIVPVASNPAVLDLRGAIPANFKLVFGNYIVMPAGLPDDAALMAEGDWIGDGQPHPHTMVLAKPTANLAMCRALADQKIQLVGIENLHHLGNPLLPASFNVPEWAAGILPSALIAINGWDPAEGTHIGDGLDPNPYGHDAGAQGSQKLICGPAVRDPSGVGPIYLCGLASKASNCHLEADGSQLDYTAHTSPPLRMYEWRPNFGISDDRLGKVAGPSTGGPDSDTHGHSGSGEHDFDWVLWGAKRLKGTKALEFLVQGHARSMIFHTPTPVPPGDYLLGPRPVGWWLFKMVNIYRELTDRVLAEAIKTHVIAVIDNLIIPRWGTPSALVNDTWWDFRSFVFGVPDACLAWQAPLATMGMLWAGQVFGHAGALTMAHDMATDVIARQWGFSGGRWKSVQIIQRGTPMLPGQPDGAYDYFFSAMGVAAMLLLDPSHATARAIWTQLESETDNYFDHRAWLCPGVVLDEPATPITGAAAVSVSTTISAAGVSSPTTIVGTAAVSVSTTMAATGVLPIDASTLDIGIPLPVSVAAAGKLKITGTTQDGGMLVSMTLMSAQSIVGDLKPITISMTMSASGVLGNLPPPPPPPPPPPKEKKPHKPRHRAEWWETTPIMNLMRWFNRRR